MRAPPIDKKACLCATACGWRTHQETPAPLVTILGMKKTAILQLASIRTPSISGPFPIRVEPTFQRRVPIDVDRMSTSLDLVPNDPLTGRDSSRMRSRLVMSGLCRFVTLGQQENRPVYRASENSASSQPVISFVPRS